MRQTLMAVFVLCTLSGWAEADTHDLMDEAAAAAAAGNHAVAMEKYRSALQVEPDNGAAHYQLAVQLMDHGGKLTDAHKHFEKAGALGFQPLGATYRLSRIHARNGEVEQALTKLEQLAEGGFGLINLIEGEADFGEIEGLPRFVAAAGKIRAARFPCQAGPKHHDFDFWIGDWRVTQNGQFAGENQIAAILGHCLIFEQWTSATGGEGKSFNYYDPGQDHWRQIWISDSGTFIEFTGQARDGGIFYTAETINPANGAVTLHKFQFTQNGDGSVRQFWETSTDAGTTWTSVWDARYERQGAGKEDAGG